MSIKLGTPINVTAIASHPTPGERLRAIRLARGFASAAEAGRAVGGSFITYQHHENGRREITIETATQYERFFDVPVGLILYGSRLFTKSTVVVTGQLVTSGGAVIRMPKGSPAVKTTSPPSTTGEVQLHAIRVATSDLFPRYGVGDVLYYDPGTSLDDANGKECCVILDNKDMMLASITRQANGLFAIVDLSGRPQYDVRIIEAHPIMWVQRAPVA